MAWNLKSLLICLIIVAYFACVFCDLHSEPPRAEGSTTTVFGDSGLESHHSHAECNDQAPAQSLIASASLAKFKSSLQIGTSAFNEAEFGSGSFAGPLICQAHRSTDLSPPLKSSFLRI